MNLHSSSMRTLGRIIQEFRVIENDMPMSYAAVFLFVCKHLADDQQRPSIRDISDGLGMVRPSISRAVMALSDNRQGRTKRGDSAPENARRGLGLLERHTDDYDLRVTRVGLSKKGEGLAIRLADQLEG